MVIGTGGANTARIRRLAGHSTRRLGEIPVSARFLTLNLTKYVVFGLTSPLSQTYLDAQEERTTCQRRSFVIQPWTDGIRGAAQARPIEVPRHRNACGLGSREADEAIGFRR